MKRWKDWPCWLKGVVIADIIFIVQEIFFWTCMYGTQVSGCQGEPCGMVCILALPNILFFMQSSAIQIPWISNILTFNLINLVLYSIVGAIIGLMVGKIKSKK